MVARNGRAEEKAIKKDVNIQIYNKYKLPITFNPLEYGTLIFKTNNYYIMKINNTNEAIIKCSENENEVTIQRNGNIVIMYKDIKINDNTFIRKINNSEYTYVDNELKLITTVKRASFIEPIKKDSNSSNTTFLTMDMETVLRNMLNNKKEQIKVHIPYLISFFNGTTSKSFYVTDYKNHEEMIIAAINDLIKYIKTIKTKDNKKFSIYIHNLANFDGIFLIKILSKLGVVKPIIHKGRLVSITFRYKKETIIFKDSLQILNSSLRKLAISFKVINKSHFPHLFINDNTSLNYIGNVPDIKFFSDITIEQYNIILKKYNNNWSLKDEAIKYCEIDCISLHQIIHSFELLIFNYFKVNIHKYATSPSLAFGIYRANFLQKNTISQISGEIANFIRKGYTGGHVNMYIPVGTKLFGYDVNSLYPFVMRDNEFPISKPMYFKGDIRAKDPNAFGFFKCKITCPQNIPYPILQTHVQTNNGIRTIAALGTYTDIIFSGEMDNAKKYGYTFEIWPTDLI